MSLVQIRTILFCSVAALNCLAGQAENWARPGRNGIFVKFGKELPKTFAYQLERKEKKGDQWKSLGVFASPKTLAQAKSTLLSAVAKNLFYGVPGDSTISDFFGKLAKSLVFDSLYSYAASPLYLEAAGDGFFDTDASPGGKYEYRLTKTGGAPVVMSADAFPGKNPGYKTKTASVQATGGSIKLAWSFSKNNYPFGIRVFREAYLQTNMQEINPKIVFVGSGDGILARVTDTDVAERVTYRYAIVPFDVFGNETPPSEAVIVLNVKPYGDAVVLKRFVAESSEKDQGIRLAWSYAEKNEMNAILVFKSEKFDSGFQALATLSPADTFYVDRNTEPVKSYYYYLVFNNVHGQSPPTSKVIGMYKSSRSSAMPPQSVALDRPPEGNRITWQKTGEDTKGYYVYRGNGYNSRMTQISQLVKAEGMDGSFVDKKENLTPGVAHSYAIVSVNSASLLSPFSDTVYAPPVPVALPVPLNLRAMKHGKGVLLAWEDMKAIAPGVTGYRVYRCSLAVKGKKYSDLKPIQVSCGINNYVDTLVLQGVRYSYALSALGNSKTESGKSLAAEYFEEVPRPFPPSGLRAVATQNSILVHWDAPATTDIREYRLYRASSGKKEALLASLKPDKTDYADKSAGKNGSFYYNVSVVNLKGEESEKSGEVGASILE